MSTCVWSEQRQEWRRDGSSILVERAGDSLCLEVGGLACGCPPRRQNDACPLTAKYSEVSFINDPHFEISLHTYYPTNFDLSPTPYAWGSASDYNSMQKSITQQIRVWLPTQAVFIREWGSMTTQLASNRAAQAQSYAQDTTTAVLVPIWRDNGGSGSESISLFDKNSGAVTQQAIVSGLMTGVKNGLAAPNTWANKP